MISINSTKRAAHKVEAALLTTSRQKILYGVKGCDDGGDGGGYMHRRRLSRPALMVALLPMYMPVSTSMVTLAL